MTQVSDVAPGPLVLNIHCMNNIKGDAIFNNILHKKHYTTFEIGTSILRIMEFILR
jgi:hypothetical protein